MKVVNVEQRTSEWHVWRKDGISATSCAVIAGKNPDKTPLMLWQELVGLVTPPDLGAIPQVKKGQKYEPLALQAFEDLYGKLGLPICAESEEYPVIRASFDGLLEQGSPVEIKNLCESKHLDVLQNKEASKPYQLYRWQVMHQMIVSGADVGYLWFWSPKHSPLCLPVNRDEALFKEIIELELSFWELVESGEPPMADPERDFMPLDGEVEQTWKAIAEKRRAKEVEIAALKEKLAELSNESGQLESELKGLMGSFKRVDAYGVKITTYEVEGGVDWKSVAEALGPAIPVELIAKYQKAPSSRTRIAVDSSFKEVPKPVLQPRVKVAASKSKPSKSTKKDASVQRGPVFWF